MIFQKIDLYPEFHGFTIIRRDIISHVPDVFMEQQRIVIDLPSVTMKWPNITLDLPHACDAMSPAGPSAALRCTIIFR